MYSDSSWTVFCIQTAREICYKYLGTKWKVNFSHLDVSVFLYIYQEICICYTLVAEYMESIGWGWEAASDDMFIIKPFPLEVNKDASTSIRTLYTNTAFSIKQIQSEPAVCLPLNHAWQNESAHLQNNNITINITVWLSMVLQINIAFCLKCYTCNVWTRWTYRRSYLSDGEYVTIDHLCDSLERGKGTQWNTHAVHTGTNKMTRLESVIPVLGWKHPENLPGFLYSSYLRCLLWRQI